MCILVVEDEFLIRDVLVEHLKDHGYTVREASSAEEAIALLDGLEPPISILVTDIHMPGRQNGLDLAIHVRDRYPTVAIVFSTGRPDVVDRTSLFQQDRLFVKPYPLRELMTCIDELAA